MLIDVVIHVHDRIHFLDRAITSLLACSDAGLCRVEVSNNSADEVIFEEVCAIAARHGVDAVSIAATNAFDHFSASVERSRADYIILLHDDDYVRRDFLTTLRRLIRDCPDACAFATDTAFEFDGKAWVGTVRPHRDFWVSPLVLAVAYCLDRCGPSFPSICYSRAQIREILSEPRAFGKYSDSMLVVEAARRGMRMSPEQSFVYVRHGSNDSQISDEPLRRRTKRALFEAALIGGPSAGRVADTAQNLRLLVGRFLKAAAP